MADIGRLWNDKKTIKLSRFSGSYFQDVLGLRWYDTDQDFQWKDASVSIYYESYSEIASWKKVPASMAKLKEDAIAGKGYFFHITDLKGKSFVGFRKIDYPKNEAFIYIFEDLKDFIMEEDPEEE